MCLGLKGYIYIYICIYSKSGALELQSCHWDGVHESVFFLNLGTGIDSVGHAYKDVHYVHLEHYVNNCRARNLRLSIFSQLSLELIILLFEHLVGDSEENREAIECAI